jgi:hypothetical protein
MPNPEEGERRRSRSPADRLFDAAAVFLASTTLAASVSTAEYPRAKQPLAEKCKEKSPLSSTDLTIDDYLGVVRWGGVVQPAPDYLDRPLFTTLLERQRKNQKHAYLTSPERNNRIENHIQQFAEDMVQKANSGDKSYRFIMRNENGGPAVDAEVPEDFEGFGYLAKGKHIGEDDSNWERQELANSIYRREDGSYYPHPGTSYLSVADKHFISTFDLVPAGHNECAYVPGNAQTLGARVNYYEFIGPGSSPWYEQADHIQIQGLFLDSAEQAKEADNHAIESLKLPPGL